MAIPTPDQTPDIRLKNISVADLEAATSPNGERCLCIEPTADADLHFRMLGYVDSAGDGRKVLAKDQDARVNDFQATGTTTIDAATGGGVVVADAVGVLSAAPDLAGLNTALGTSIDKSTDPRDPNVHHLTHENGGADEISVAGLSGELADAQPTTRQKAYAGGAAVAIDATHFITRTKKDGGAWILTDEAGTRVVMKWQETDGDGVVATLNVDALVSSSTGGCVHTIQGDGSEDDSAVRVHTEMTDSGVDPDHSVQLAEWTVNHDDVTETESGVWIFAEYDGEDM